MATVEPVLQLYRVSKAFGELPVLRDVSVSLCPGEGLALQGGNGTGKSTLLRLALGLLRPDEGTILLDGFDPITHPAAARRRVGYVPQRPAFPPGLTVGEVWDFFSRCRGATAKDKAAAISATGIDGWMNRRVETLSGGMTQRLAIAIALSGNPRLLVLDEPGANLDRASFNRLLTNLREMRDHGVAVLLATHDAREVQAVAQRVMVLDHEGGAEHALVVPEAGRHLGTAVCPA